eukprot:UN15202
MARFTNNTKRITKFIGLNNICINQAIVKLVGILTESIETDLTFGHGNTISTSINIFILTPAFQNLFFKYAAVCSGVN